MTNRPRQVAAWVACALALGMFAVVVVIPAARKPNTTGFATLFTESRILLSRPTDLRRVYDDAWFQQRVDEALGPPSVLEIARGQPPTMALMLVPLAGMSPTIARAVWILASVGFWVAGLAILAASLGLNRAAGMPAVVWLAAMTTLYRPLTDNLRRGQGYALMFFFLCLVIFVFANLPARRSWAAGLPLALMLILKSAGLGLYPLLVVARQWRALAAAVVFAVVVVLCCSPLIGAETWRTYLNDAFSWIASEPSNHVTAYQTVRGMAGHLFIYHPQWNPRPIAHQPWLAKGITLLFLTVVLAVSGRYQRLRHESRVDRLLTLAMFVSLLVVVAPIGEGYHYMLVLPAVVIAWWWVIGAKGSAARRVWLAGCTALLCAPPAYYNSASVTAGVAALLAYPMVYGAVGVWILLVRALVDLERLERRGAATTPSPRASPHPTTVG